MNLMTPQALQKLKDEMMSSGISNFSQYTGQDCWVNLSYTIVAFTKQLLSFLEDGLKLYMAEVRTQCKRRSHIAVGPIALVFRCNLCIPHRQLSVYSINF